MEEVDTITVAVSGIDINKVEPLDTRRLVTFINHYLATTVSFLNHFASQCESKLDRMQQQLHRVECRLKLLECKLASIPGIPSTPTVESAQQQSTGPVPGTSSSSKASTSNSAPPPPPPPISESSNSNPQQPSPAVPNHLNAAASSSSTSSSPVPNSTDKESSGEGGRISSETQEDASDGKPGTNNRDDPRYAKYFKMITVGVPVPAVKQKMMSEGVDPSILDN